MSGSASFSKHNLWGALNFGLLGMKYIGMTLTLSATDDAPTTSEWSTILLPTKVHSYQRFEGSFSQGADPSWRVGVSLSMPAQPYVVWSQWIWLGEPCATNTVAWKWQPTNTTAYRGQGGPTTWNGQLRLQTSILEGKKRNATSVHQRWSLIFFALSFW